MNELFVCSVGDVAGPEGHGAVRTRRLRHLGCSSAHYLRRYSTLSLRLTIQRV
jgi:hypothetical protein